MSITSIPIYSFCAHKVFFFVNMSSVGRGDANQTYPNFSKLSDVSAVITSFLMFQL